jgi:hypothetical protein
VTVEKRIFGYQKSLYDNLLVLNTNNSLQHDKPKHLWVRKATGVDLIELMRDRSIYCWTYSV